MVSPLVLMVSAQSLQQFLGKFYLGGFINKYLSFFGNCFPLRSRGKKLMVCTEWSSCLERVQSPLTLVFQFRKACFSVSMEMIAFIEDFHTHNISLTETADGDTL